MRFPEVRRRLSFAQRGSFAGAVCGGPALPIVSVEIQAWPVDLDRPHKAPTQKEAIRGHLHLRGHGRPPIQRSTKVLHRPPHRLRREGWKRHPPSRSVLPILGTVVLCPGMAS